MDNNEKINILIKVIKHECAENYPPEHILREINIGIQKFINNNTSFLNDYLEALKKIEGVYLQEEIRDLVVKIEKDMISKILSKDKILNRKNK